MTGSISKLLISAGKADQFLDVDKNGKTIVVTDKMLADKDYAKRSIKHKWQSSLRGAISEHLGLHGAKQIS